VSNNFLIALDILNSSLSTAARIQELMQKSEIENRDITDEELDGLFQESDKLHAEFKSNIPS